MKATFIGKDFKKLIADVTKFPGIGGFAGSGLVNLKVANGKATAISSGLVTARTQCPAEGELPYIAVDERIIQPFSTVCPDGKKVIIESTDIIRMRCKVEETSPLTKGVHYDLIKIKDLLGVERYTITKDLAEKISYLAAVAFADSSKPELNCVMLNGKGSAMAVSQKLIAELTLKEDHTLNKLAVAIPIARLVEEGDVLVVGYSELKDVATKKTSKKHVSILTRKSAMYQMPSPVRAQQEFPIETIETYQKTPKKEVAVCDGASISETIQEANVCLGQLSKLDLRLRLTGAKEKVELIGEKGGVLFRSRINGSVKSDFDLTIPMDEMVHVIPFLVKEKQVQIGVGSKNGETFFTLPQGWVMMPALSKK